MHAVSLVGLSSFLILRPCRGIQFINVEPNLPLFLLYTYVYLALHANVQFSGTTFDFIALFYKKVCLLSPLQFKTAVSVHKGPFIGCLHYTIVINYIRTCCSCRRLV
jgi:hypothetical protein